MSTTAWHADATLLRRYLNGTADLSAAASVEAHLISCARCREGLARLSPAADLAPAWDRVVAGIATPRPSPAVRLLRRSGLSDADVVLLRAARALDGSWTLAVIAVVAFAALAALSNAAGGRALYLLVAPLVPVMGVVASFASFDPLHDVTVATPYSKARLALVRAGAVCVTSVPVVVALGVSVPPIGSLAFAWLLPSLALTLLSLLVMTAWSPVAAGTSAGVIWVSVVAVAHRADEAAAAVDPRLMPVYLTLAGLGAVALAVRLTTAPGGHR